MTSGIEGQSEASSAVCDVQNIPLNERRSVAEMVAADFDKSAYDSMPVESFGTFMIKKMGFDEKIGIGKKNQIVRPIEFVPRSHRQGLGADPMPSILQKQKDGKPMPKGLQKHLVSKTGKNYNYIGDELIDLNKPLEVNEAVSIVAGKHIGLNAIIVKIDKEKEEAIVELNNRQTVKVDFTEIKRAATIRENTQTNQEKRRDGSVSSSRSDSQKETKKGSKRIKKDKKEKKDKKHKKKSHKSERDSSLEIAKDKKKRKEKKEKSSKDRKAKKHSRRNDSRSPSSSSSQQQSDALKWVHPSIRVRVISKDYKDGRFYNVKGIVTDLLDIYTFSLTTPSREILEDLTEVDVETVMPELNKTVLVLSGEYKASRATLIERNKRLNQVRVQLHDTLEIITLTQDDVSELVA